jgi:thioredoxin 1
VSIVVTELDTAGFDKFIKENKIALIDCWAPWCGPCRRMGPIIEELAVELKGKVGVAKLNTDNNQAIAEKYRINAIPTLLVFKDQVQQPSMVGLRPKDEIVKYLSNLK